MEAPRGKFITIHGIDGTGKTTTTEKLHQRLVSMGEQAINYDTHKNDRPNPFAQKKELADREGSPEERLAAYLESTMFHSEQIEDLRKQGFHVMKSRYLDDVLAHHSHLGLSEEVLQAGLRKFPIVQPDLKVILTADESKRRDRIEGRGILDARDAEHKAPGSRARYFEDYLMQFAQKAPEGSVLHLDTGELDAEEVVERIIRSLMQVSSVRP